MYYYWYHRYFDEAGEEINSKLPIAFVLRAIIVVALFNAFKQPLIILLILPLSIIGVTVGLLVTDKPFGFMALLGVLSLFGMLIKNAVVLLDHIDVEIREGASPYLAVVNSSITRMRPVLMASFTTVLGMIPLISDPLYGPMAVAIMSGLSFATILTLIVVPVLYTMFFRIDVNA
jgi:multidrug efflux pump subunit AcrB